MAPPALVMLHGFLGFSHWGPIDYFRGVQKALVQQHLQPLIPDVPGSGTIAERAETLARKLFRSDVATFALIGHSMGGLDARYLITYLDPDRRVKSLLTVATPHSGTTLASWMLESHGPIPAWFRHVGRPALDELTPASRSAMPIPNRADVNYSSYASQRPPHELPFWLRPYGSVIPEDNDGMVPVNSARWGTFRGTVCADHIELLGWSLGLPDARSGRPFNHLPFWLRAATETLSAAESSIRQEPLA